MYWYMNLEKGKIKFEIRLMKKEVTFNMLSFEIRALCRRCTCLKWDRVNLQSVRKIVKCIKYVKYIGNFYQTVYFRKKYILLSRGDPV